MDWYIIIKKIKGNRYYYYQKTYRVGKQVKTQNVYYGPVNKVARPPSRLSTGANTTAISTKRIHIPPRPKPAPVITHPDLTGATTIPIPFPEPDVIKRLLQYSSDRVGWKRGWGTQPQGINQVREHPRVIQAIKVLGIDVTHRTDGAYYRVGTNIINIPPQECYYDDTYTTATSRWNTTVLHEIVHWTGNSYRLARVHSGSRATQRYAKEELIAELGAVKLAQHFGIEINWDHHGDYFTSWLKAAGNKDKAIEYAEREAERAVNYILAKTGE